MAGKVISGAYKGKAVGISANGKKAYIFTKTLSLNKNTWLELNNENVKEAKIISENSSGMGASMVKEAIFGTAAAMAKNQVLVSVEFKDGEKSLIQCDKKTFQAIQIGCF